MPVPEVAMFSKIISNNDKGKDQRNAKQNKSTRAASGIINTFHSLWICVAILLHMASKTTVEAFCTPANGTSLTFVVNACLKETPDGSCPNFAASSDSPGCGHGGVNGVIGDWDVSSVTDLSSSTSLCLTLFSSTIYLILIMNLLLTK